MHPPDLMSVAPMDQLCIDPIPEQSSTDLEQFCQIPIQHLLRHLPITHLWLSYWDAERSQQQFLTHHSDTPSTLFPMAGIDVGAMQYLRSQTWFNGALPLLKIQKLVLPSYPNLSIWVCGLGTYEEHSDYLLFWSDQPFSHHDQHQILEQARLLNQHLKLHRELLRQKTETQLLEQILRRAEHQLRSPLALIRLYAENLCLGGASEAVPEQAGLIRDTVEELSTHLNRLIRCARQANLQLCVHDLRSIVSACVKQMTPWLAEKQLKLRIPPTSVILTLDRWQIQQAFHNILDNAIHFSPLSGQITVDWQVYQQEVHLTIADQGPGLSTDDLSQVFVPFYSRRNGGTGLGLAIAKKIILDHHGSIWADNLPEGGAQFSIVLPR